MKRSSSLFSSLTVLSLAIVSSGCDMLKMPETTQQMNETTQHMSKTTEKMSSTTDNMNRQMGQVKDAAHLQVVFGALAAMMDDKNTKRLTPVPLEMLPGAKKFAETAFEDELVDWFYVEYKGLVDSTPDTSQLVAVPVLLPKVEASGKAVLEVQYEEKTVSDKRYMTPIYERAYPEAYIAEFNHKNDVTLSAMEAVAAFIPQEMIEDIVDQEIVGRGKREQMAYLILNLRDSFTRKALLKSSLYEDKLKNFKQVEEAERLVKNLDYIASLPYAAQIASTTIKGYLSISPNYVYATHSRLPEKGTGALAPIHVSDQDENPKYNAATVDYDLIELTYNPNEMLYSVKDDGISVAAADQNAARASAIQYDPKMIQRDWKDLKTHLSVDLRDLIKTPEGKRWLEEINSHIH